MIRCLLNPQPSGSKCAWSSGLICAIATMIVLVCCQRSDAGPFTYSFKRITNGSSTDVASQLTVVVADAGVFTGDGNSADDKYKGRNQVSFTFLNNVGKAASITDVYFDDGSLLDLVTVKYSTGVKFSEVATPSNLPGGNSINFNTSKGFSADSDNPVLENGVNKASEWVTLTFVLKDNPNGTHQTYADTIAAMELSLLPQNYGQDITGGLRIGVHVQGIGTDGKSDSYVNAGALDNGNNGGQSDSPEPATAALWGIGIAALLGWKRLRRRRALPSHAN